MQCQAIIQNRYRIRQTLSQKPGRQTLLAWDQKAHNSGVVKSVVVKVLHWTFNKK